MYSNWANKSELGRLVKDKWISKPINEKTFDKLLQEYTSYLESDVCDSRYIRTDEVAVIYKWFIEKFSKWLKLDNELV